MNAIQESNGDTSVRRLLAVYYAALSGACLIIGALNGTMAGVWAGGVCALVVLLLSAFITITDVKEIAHDVAGKLHRKMGGEGE